MNVRLGGTYIFRVPKAIGHVLEALGLVVERLVDDAALAGLWPLLVAPQRRRRVVRRRLRALVEARRQLLAHHVVLALRAGRQWQQRARGVCVMVVCAVALAVGLCEARDVSGGLRGTRVSTSSAFTAVRLRSLSAESDEVAVGPRRMGSLSFVASRLSLVSGLVSLSFCCARVSKRHAARLSTVSCMIPK